MSLTTPAEHGGDPGVMTCFVDGAFPREFIDHLNRVAVEAGHTAETGGIQKADATAARVEKVRRSEVVWLKDEGRNHDVYEMVFEFVKGANAQVYRYDLQQFEPFQLATYHGAPQEGGFYGWHVDIGSGRLAHRKLSLVIPLTDPSEYEGGEFQAFYDDEPHTIDMPLGRVLAFPSYMLHRVTPVTRGVRRSLAVWVSGTPFR